MQSSRRIIKASHSLSPIGSAEVTTTWQPKQKESFQEEEISIKEQFHDERQKIEAIIQAKELEKEAILATARQEAEEIKQLAEKEGYQLGENKGIQDGFRSGYQDGIKKATEEAVEVKEQANRLLIEATKQVERFYEDKKKEMVELAAQMAGKIVHEKIDTSDEKLINLLTPILSRMEQKSTFITITVTPEMQEIMKKNVTKLESEYPLFRFTIFADASLEKNGCIIESPHAIVDLQVKQQLEAIVADLKEL